MIHFPLPSVSGITRLRLGAAAGAFLLGFAVASVPRKESGDVSGAERPAESNDQAALQAWAEKWVGEANARGGTKSDVMMRRLASARSDGVGMQILDLMRLVRSTPADELESLLLESERTLSDSTIGESVGKAIFARMKEECPEALMELGVQGRSRFLSREDHIFVDFALEHAGVERVVEAFGGIASQPRKLSLLRMALSGVADEDPYKAMQLASELDPEEQLAVREMAVYRLCQKGDAEGLELVLALPESDRRSDCIQMWFDQAVRENPDAALARVSDLPTMAERDKALRTIGRSWSGADKDASIAYSRRIESPLLRASFLQGMLENGHDWKPEERLAVIELLPFRNWREKAAAKWDAQE